MLSGPAERQIAHVPMPVCEVEEPGGGTRRLSGVCVCGGGGGQRSRGAGGERQEDENQRADGVLVMGAANARRDQAERRKDRYGEGGGGKEAIAASKIP